MLVTDSLTRNALLKPEKVALIFRGENLTYRTIDEASNVLCNALIEIGFQPRDRGLIYLDNSMESIITLFAILKAGGIFVIISPLIKTDKLRYILGNCQPKVIFTRAEYSARTAEAIIESTSVKNIVIIDDIKGYLEKPGINERMVLPFQELLSSSHASCPKPRVIDMDIASLIYTSGSTGLPKGVMVSHLNMISSIYSVTQYLQNNCDDIILNALPLSHSYGLYQILMAFHFGGTIVLEKSFTYPQQIVNLAVIENVTGWPLVPTMVAILMHLKNLKQENFPSLRYITSAGQSLPPKHILKLREVFPKVKIFSMYGLTECKRVSYLDSNDIDRKPDSVGKPMPNVDTYIVDNDGQVLDQVGEIGELVVRGSNVMKGYWKLPAETDKALRPGLYPGEKVLHTGDLFKKDEEGFLYFMGRKDDIIKSGGYMVSPREVEDVLCDIEDVVEAAVIGVEDELLGKAVKAFVHLKSNSKITPNEITGFCSTRLEQYAVPKFINFCGELPHTENGKIRKRDLS